MSYTGVKQILSDPDGEEAKGAGNSGTYAETDGGAFGNFEEKTS